MEHTEHNKQHPVEEDQDQEDTDLKERQGIVLPDEKVYAFIKLMADFENNLAPQGAVEKMLVEDIVINQWRRCRMRVLETTLVAAESERHHDKSSAALAAGFAYRSLSDQSRVLELLRRGESRYASEIASTLRLLSELRERRQARPDSGSAIPPEKPLDVN